MVLKRNDSRGSDFFETDFSALYEHCLHCFWSTKKIAEIHLVPSLSECGMFISAPYARPHVLELWRILRKRLNDIGTQKGKATLCIFSVEHSLQESQKCRNEGA